MNHQPTPAARHAPQDVGETGSHPKSDDQTHIKANKQKHEQIHVALLTDQNYVVLTSVAIASLVSGFLRFSPHERITLNIHVVCIGVDGVAKTTMQKAAQAAQDTHAGQDKQTARIATIRLHCHDHTLPDKLQGKRRWIRLVSQKIHLPDILPDLDRVIFLDSDTVIIDDITTLWQTNLDGHWMAAVPCLLDNPRNLLNYNIFKIRFDETSIPINAGVMILDLALMRHLGVTGKLAAWQETNFHRLKLPEQEAIALNFPGQWKVLPHAWNFRPYGEPCWTAASWEEFQNYLQIQPCIVHFQGNVRPFEIKLNLPYYSEWTQAHDLAHPGQIPQRKTAGYFQFVFFEFPDVLCRLGNLLPGGLLRFGLMIPLLGLITLPRSAFSYLRYLKHPENYRLRIYDFMPLTPNLQKETRPASRKGGPRQSFD